MEVRILKKITSTKKDSDTTNNLRWILLIEFDDRTAENVNSTDGR